MTLVAQRKTTLVIEVFKNVQNYWGYKDVKATFAPLLLLLIITHLLLLTRQIGVEQNKLGVLCFHCVQQQMS